MARFRALKSQIRSLREAGGGRAARADIAPQGQAATGPLMGSLALDQPLRLRAAVALGRTTALLHYISPEQARDVMRRLNWRMSEESGNLGWGVPEAVGEVLSQCPPLAKDFYRIFFSTILDLGFDDNYVDNDQLRRSCYFAIGRFLRAAPERGPEVRPLLRKGLEDADGVCRGMAAWALGVLPPDLNDVLALRRLSEERDSALCSITDGDETVERTAAELALDTLAGKRPVCS